jgi:hypothetical protein
VLQQLHGTLHFAFALCLISCLLFVACEAKEWSLNHEEDYGSMHHHHHAPSKNVACGQWHVVETAARKAAAGVLAESC